MALYRTQAIASSADLTGDAMFAVTPNITFAAAPVAIGAARYSLLTPQPMGRVRCASITRPLRASSITPIVRFT